MDDANDFYATVTPRELVHRRARRHAAGLRRDAVVQAVLPLRGARLAATATPSSRRRPPNALQGRNHEWTHLYNADVISMPDKWEYPWYAAWDLAFHCLPLALVDPEFAKDQLVLMTREWYMHPNGQLPAYEWAFGDVNPPVHAWAAWRVYKIEQKRRGKPDRAFLERVFHKLLLNFTWWVNRKDAQGRNVFQGGFLGLDNIGVFDRSEPLPTGGFIEQADGTGWMAMYCLNLLAIALELAREDSAYEDVASKFWEHFLYIAHAINHLGEDGEGMWDEEDGFFYDVLHLPDGSHVPLKVRSMVGLIPLFAVETLEPRLIDQFPGFKRRMEWFIANRRDLTAQRGLDGGARPRASAACSRWCRPRRLAPHPAAHAGRRRVPVALRHSQPLALPQRPSLHLQRRRAGAPRGLRARRIHHRPVRRQLQLARAGLVPAQLPAHRIAAEVPPLPGRRIPVECPTGSGRTMTLWEVAAEISRRLSRLFLKDDDGRRPANGATECFQLGPALARPGAVPRILPRRQRRRPGRQPSDRVDGPGGQAAAAERGVRVTGSYRMSAMSALTRLRRYPGFLIDLVPGRARTLQMPEFARR